MECNQTMIFLLCTLYVCVTIASGKNIATKIKTSDEDDTEPRASGNLCLTPACIHSASRILMSMNSSVSPCDDFYEFTCGNYANSVPLAPSELRIDPHVEAAQIMTFRLQQLIEEIDETNSPKPFRLVKTYYEQCLNDSPSWRNDTALLKATMEKIAQGNGWPLRELESWNMTNFNYTLSFLSLFHFSFDSNMENITDSVLNLGERNPPLDSHYFAEGFSNEVVQAYYQYMIDVAVYLGCNETKAKTDLNETLSLEIELYQKVFTKHDDPDEFSHYSKVLYGELAKKYPIIFSNPSKFDANTPVQLEFDEETLDRAIKWLSTKPKRALANWAAWRIVAAKVPYVSSYLSHIDSAFRQIINGKISDTCVYKTRNSLGLALFALYQRKYISQSSVDDVVAMLGNIKEQFLELVQKVEWLDDETRKKFVEKVSKIESNVILCREPISDDELEAFYSDLELSNSSFWETSKIVAKFYDMKSLNIKLPFVPLSRNFCGKSWFYTAYHRRFNYLAISTGSLSGFLYDIDRPKYLNYGLYSEGIGHESGHSLDATNINYDTNGNLKPWSNLKSKNNYMDRVQCFIDQYENYTIDGSKIHLNGYSTVGENMADYTGAKTARRAYAKWANTSLPEQRLPGLNYSANQMFWIAMANSWCAKYRAPFMKNLLYIDEHAPNKFRVNGPLSNIEEFSKDFGCRLGTKMNPENKCHLW
ncbi:neprilysin-2-like [Venturia canescens]|uniref:neprilysin-2-like n=1 Tax=Venturia canescens TaxID=32260 RepID=UPI001C9D60F1|nr:neprilysin-2-like [Venturia canescens]